MSIRILALLGSLRIASYNRQLAEAAIKLAPEGIDVDLYEGLAEVPFYNEDLDQPAVIPPAADDLRVAVRSADALLLVTPEYNGSIPAALKNAIDWVSRPQYRAAVIGKPVVVVGTSGGRYGGAWAHEDARKVARAAGATVLDEIALSVPHAATRFADAPPVCDEEIISKLPIILAALAGAAQSCCEPALSREVGLPRRAPQPLSD
ncbi:FMN reductase [Mycobacterium kyorinense]|uniref:FMN reductase n=1 Tax=Mycobacterium kyorinense TaxID=487514 RepID=A0A1A2ZN42_9MYCO|nr:NAD(P)H-dependent oxidoreductase [Mycobacterium kyorinense]OBI51710.1 FMN reductase [Mycobacterium kyorinense]